MGAITDIYAVIVEKVMLNGRGWKKKIGESCVHCVTCPIFGGFFVGLTVLFIISALDILPLSFLLHEVLLKSLLSIFNFIHIQNHICYFFMTTI